MNLPTGITRSGVVASVVATVRGRTVAEGKAFS